ncbi:MAG: hypothetical protein JRI72_00245 [Deltaproteobacteria bacterium]|nr:hypothetical protein [Deltaproteobacteria bacterium]
METIKTLKTPRGNLNIKAVFKTVREAKAEGWSEYFTNEDGTQIFTKHYSEYSVYFSIVADNSPPEL